MKQRSIWLSVFYGAVLLFGACVILACYTDFQDFCPAEEKPALCLREWIGAAGGYIATVFAAITIFFLYRQNAEQKKQTDFALGDAPPTMDVTEDQEDREQVVVRIVNWNRRGVILQGVDFRGVGDASIGIMEFKIDGKDWEFEERIGYPYIRGWENRQIAPQVAQYKLAASIGDKVVTSWPDSTEALVYLQIIDENHQLLTLRASLFPKSALNQ